MAREGLRTLVVAKKVLTEDQYQEFEVCCFVCRDLKSCFVRIDEPNYLLVFVLRLLIIVIVLKAHSAPAL